VEENGYFVFLKRWLCVLAKTKCAVCEIGKNWFKCALAKKKKLLVVPLL